MVGVIAYFTTILDHFCTLYQRTNPSSLLYSTIPLRKVGWWLLMPHYATIPPSKSSNICQVSFQNSHTERHLAWLMLVISRSIPMRPPRFNVNPGFINRRVQYHLSSKTSLFWGNPVLNRPGFMNLGLTQSFTVTWIWFMIISWWNSCKSFITYTNQ